MSNQYSALSEYELRHLPAHLLQAGQTDDLCGLARDEDFLTAQTEELPNEPDAATGTLQTALRGTCEQDNAANMAEFLMKHRDRMDAAQNEPPLAALRRGQLRRAIRLADLLPPDRGSLVQLLLACELAATDRASEAAKLLDRLLERQWYHSEPESEYHAASVLALLYRDCPGPAVALARRWFDAGALTGDAAMRALITTLIRQGELGAAESLCEVLPEGNCSLVRRDVAKRWLDLGRTGEAVRLAGDIGHPHSQSEVLWAIAEAQAKAGDLAAARRAIEAAVNRGQSVGWQRLKAASWAEAGAVEARWGEPVRASTAFERAIGIARAGEQGLKSVQALGDVAAALARGGRPDEARHVFDEAAQVAVGIEKHDDRDDAIKELARAQLRVGFTSAALMTARGMHGKYQMSFLLNDIAQGQFREGQAEAARLTFAEAALAGHTSPDVEGLALEPVAVGQATSGFIEDAIQTAQSIRDPYWRAFVLWRTAGPVFLREGAGAADALLRQAIEASNRTGEQQRRGQNLSHISGMYARHGQTEVAVRIAKAIEDARSRRAAFVLVGDELVRSGQLADARLMFQSAFLTASDSPSERWRGKALRPIAVGQARAGRMEAAARTAACITDSREQAETYLDIAALHVAAGRARDATASFDLAVRSAADEGVLGLIAAGQARAGQVRESLQTCPTITPKLAEAISLAGSPNVAFEAAIALKDSKRQVAVVLAIVSSAPREVSKPLLEAAVLLSNQTDNFLDRVELLTGVVPAQVAAGLFAESHAGVASAMQLAASAKGDTAWWKQWGAGLLLRIGRAQAAAGDLDGAGETVLMLQPITHGEERDALRRAIAEAQAKQGDVAAAIRTAREIYDHQTRASALLAIAAEQHRVGGIPTEALDLAAGAIGGEPDPSKRLTLLIEMCGRCLDAGQADLAAETFGHGITLAKQVAYETRRWSEGLICDVAFAAVRFGKPEVAVDVMLSLPDAEGWARPRVMRRLLEFGHLAQFKELLLTCGDHARSVWEACGLLPEAYPDQLDAIALVLLEAEGPSPTTPAELAGAIPPGQAGVAAVVVKGGESDPHPEGDCKPSTLRQSQPPPPAAALPTSEELRLLPRWALVAFVARCARRGQEVFARWTDAPAEHVAAVRHAVEAMEQAAARAEQNPRLNLAAVRSAVQAAHDAKKSAAYNLELERTVDIEAARRGAAVVYASLRVGRARSAADAGRFAEQVVQGFAGKAAHAAALRADLGRLLAAASGGHWTDETPIAAGVFGPLEG